jgi:hypothetical protein
MLDALLLYPIRFLCLGVALAILCGARISRRAVWIVGGLGLAAYLVAVISDPPRGKDFAEYFWPAGQALHHGENPYDVHGVINPPTAFPFYLAIGAVPLAAIRVIWIAGLVFGALLVVEMGRRALVAAGDGDARRIEPSFVLLLTAILCQSRANRMGIELGQLALPVTLFVLGAFWAYHRGCHVIAGALMALASVKTPTMLPCLLVFHRRSDWKVWAALAVTGFGLVLSTTAPGDIIPRCRDCLRGIAATRAEGHTDDIGIANHRNTSMVSLDLLLNRLGMTDPGAVQPVQGAILLGLLLVIAWMVLGRDRVSPAAAMSMIALYAMLFLYHRLYDLLLLALPLVYVSGRARSATGQARWLYVGCAACMLVAMNTMPWMLSGARERVLNVDDSFSALLRVLVLPHLTWMVLTSLVLLLWAERAANRVPHRELNGSLLIARAKRETVNKTMETAR